MPRRLARINAPVGNLAERSGRAEARPSGGACFRLPGTRRGASLEVVGNRWRAFRFPIDPEKQALLRARWESLPDELRTPNQLAGRHLTHCGFITGASYCSFRCTHCYLPQNANEVPIPSLAEMKEQIEANRRFQGPGGGLQITGGDVADAYWRAGRQSELVEIVRHAVGVGLVPMLMTHGQTLLEHPEFLEALVIDGGLRQVAVHIDMTQAGRHGFPINRLTSETDLHPVREAFTELARKIRARTRLPLELAHNCTVTERNIDSIAEVVRWFLADPARSRIWRILSFQPEANTGRTIFLREISLNLMKSIIAPLVFSTIVVGIAGAGSLKKVGRMCLKAIVYFEVATTGGARDRDRHCRSTRPGMGVELVAGPNEVVNTVAQTHSKTLLEIVTHIFPASVIDAMARGDVLQIVAFSVLFAMAVSAIGKR